ncbi:hypothetical protein Lalb_Chr14g0372231 [Lupinus albus]|uniref:Uncharacterized protein n=1 Tax=Lupinus albus TaxID=3870 RepID=A0A6A4PFY0_LUPAL|nr:hypothetical protein Lalb_Chr14g0372231 [Lupinus albus]
MASTATTTTQNFQNHNNNSNNGNLEISKQEIQSAIAKAVELRAIHAALTHGSSPVNARFSSPSPVSRSVSQFSAQDYPVFAPSYEDDSVPYNQSPTKSRIISECWNENLVETRNIIETTIPDHKEKTSLRKALDVGYANLNSPHICPVDDAKSATGSCANHITVLQTSPTNDYFKSRRRNSLDDFKPVSSCNRCNPAVITSEFDNIRINKSSNIVVPLTDSHVSFRTQPKSKSVISWLFPRFKKKHNKNESSPNRTEYEEVPHVLKDTGIVRRVNGSF